jgi:putative FmdB family regulatory protein
MPIYVYYCATCEEFWDEILPSPPPEWIVCPMCKTDKAYKQVTAHSLHAVSGDNSSSTPPRKKGF